MINEELRESCFGRVTDEKARRVYDLICDACETRENGMTDADQMLVGDYAYAEQIKQMLQDDIAERGLGQSGATAGSGTGKKTRARPSFGPTASSSGRSWRSCD